MDDLAKHEHDKYKKVWERPEYRKTSPGHREIEGAAIRMGLTSGDFVIDYGSGTGRATKWLQDHGMEVLAVDHVDNALEFDLPFVKTNLWTMGAEVPVSDHAFCSDVLEHIPPEYVDEVFLRISMRTRESAYFRIATRPDVMGKMLVGEPLHLTIQPDLWWIEQAQKWWSKVDIVRTDGRDVVFICRNPKVKPSEDSGTHNSGI